jgi:hypothetical protein
MSAHMVAQEFIDHMQSGDVEKILGLAAPGATVSVVPLGVDGSMATEGADYLRELARSFPDLLVVARRLFVTTDNTAVVEISLEGTQADSFLEPALSPARGQAARPDLDRGQVSRKCPAKRQPWPR